LRRLVARSPRVVAFVTSPEGSLMMQQFPLAPHCLFERAPFPGARWRLRS